MEDKQVKYFFSSSSRYRRTSFQRIFVRHIFPQYENLWKSFYDKVLLFVDEFIWKGNEQRGRARKILTTLVQVTRARVFDNDAMRLTMKSHKLNGRWGEDDVQNVNLIFYALLVF